MAIITNSDGRRISSNPKKQPKTPGPKKKKVSIYRGQGK